MMPTALSDYQHSHSSFDKPDGPISCFLSFATDRLDLTELAPASLAFEGATVLA
jgi:hypothetical protein